MKKFFVISLICLIIATAVVIPAASSADTQASDLHYGTTYYDIAINNGRVIDPLTGFDGMANVGIKDGVIAVIVTSSQKLSGAREIDATGLTVAPGFINIHSHITDLGNGGGPLYLQDGITTEISGNCGILGQVTFSKFAEQLEQEGLYANVATYVGHNSMREAVGVPNYRTPATPEQLVQMEEMLRQGMQDGAIGVSFGPFYGPGASYPEMLALAKVSAEYGGCAASHVRDAFTPGGAVKAVNEAISTAREANIPFIISHTGGGPTVVPRSSGPVLEAIYEGMDEGLKLGIDWYGYDAFLTELGAAIFDYPPEMLMQLMESQVSDLEVPSTVVIDGKVYMQAGERFSSIEQFLYVRQKVKSKEIPDPMLVGHLYKPAKQKFWMSNPYLMIENDCTMTVDKATGKYAGHPKDAGAFAHFLGYWVRQQGVCDLRTALARTSGMAAYWLGLDKKGRVQVGCDADLVLFDPGTIIDKSTYTEPGQASYGIPYVIVNGVLAVDNSKLTGARAGKVIKRTWTVPGLYPNLSGLPPISVSALNP
ncbi:MAG: amidohydrolase family protein [Dehalococcoidia bacterium]